MSYKAKINSAQTLALVLQQSRLAAGITQRSLADQLGVSHRYIYEMERGRESKEITRILAALAATGAVMTIDVPEGEPVPERVPKVLTPEQMKTRLAEAKQDRERNEILRAQGYFGHNDYNPGRSRPNQ